jgi:predicted SAM-dependent methyltransferase
MSNELILFEEEKYPLFQSQGNASQFAIPFAKHFCKGTGYDIGYNKEDWKYPNSIGIDINDTLNNYDANNLPDELVDYIYSSHCLEHLDNWIESLELWISKIKEGGLIFLYLPDFSQKYWRPWNNRKHKHIFTPEILKEFCKSKNLQYSCSGVDLNNSFIIVIYK